MRSFAAHHVGEPLIQNHWYWMATLRSSTYSINVRVNVGISGGKITGGGPAGGGGVGCLSIIIRGGGYGGGALTSGTDLVKLLGNGTSVWHDGGSLGTCGTRPGSSSLFGRPGGGAGCGMYLSAIYQGPSAQHKRLHSNTHDR